MDKERLARLIKEGKTNRQIALEMNCSPHTVSYQANKYGLQYLYKYPKYEPYRLDSVETPEQAYVLGFIIADAAIQNETIEISVAVKDIGLATFIADVLGVKTREDYTLVRSTRRFPRIRLTRKIHGILKFIGQNKKHERNVPRIARNLEAYMVRGIFDADGCITWGRRKDRNRIWHKVCFTSSWSICSAIQMILYKQGISSAIRPKGKEKCFVLEFANRNDVLRFYDYLYQDKSFVPLQRKFEHFNALRLELGEIGGTANGAIPSRALDHSKEGVETTGGINGFLNNRNSTQGININYTNNYAKI